MAEKKKKKDWQAKLSNPSEQCKDFIGSKFLSVNHFHKSAQWRLEVGRKRRCLVPYKWRTRAILQYHTKEECCSSRPGIIHLLQIAKWGKSSIFKPASAETRLAPRWVDWCKFQCGRWHVFSEDWGLSSQCSRFIVPGDTATPCSPFGGKKNRLRGMITRCIDGLKGN